MSKKANRTAFAIRFDLYDRALWVFVLAVTVEASRSNNSGRCPLRIFPLNRPWLMQVLHPNVMGAIPGVESYPIAWDVQGDLEPSMLSGVRKVLSSYDYMKYFDSFDFFWTKALLIHCGMMVQLAQIICDLYSNMVRTLKSGRALSNPFKGANGLGQGDVMSLMPALLTISWQFKVIDRVHRKTIHAKGYLDDRTFIGTCDDTIALDKTAYDFDTLAGQQSEPGETVFMATDTRDRDRLNKHNLSCEKGKMQSTHENRWTHDHGRAAQGVYVYGRALWESKKRTM